MLDIETAKRMVRAGYCLGGPDVCKRQLKKMVRTNQIGINAVPILENEVQKMADDNVPFE